jgi:uncharacterized protein
LLLGLGFFAMVPTAWLACRQIGAPVSDGTVGTADNLRLLESTATCGLARMSAVKIATRSLANAVNMQDTSFSSADVRKAYAAAQSEWQATEVFAFGPLGAPSSDPKIVSSLGGKDLRSGIYAWPKDSRCAVSRALVSQAYARPDFAEKSISAERGLSALETLLFAAADTSGCMAGDAAEVGLAALSAEERSARRLAYAKVVAADLATRADEVERIWSKEGGNFAGDLGQPGKASKVYADERQALNALGETLVVLGLTIKNMKLGTPLGYQACGEATTECLGKTESLYAGLSRDHIRDNLRGMQMIIEGCGPGGAGIGFDDILNGMGKDAQDFSGRLVQDLHAAQLKVEALPAASLLESNVKDPVATRAAYDALKLLEVDLKTEFLSILNLELTQVVPSDND